METEDGVRIMTSFNSLSTGAFPTGYDQLCATRDPMTPPSVLRVLYADLLHKENDGLIESELEYLQRTKYYDVLRNPSLPFDLVEHAVHELEYSNVLQASLLFINPSITVDQVRDLINRVCEVSYEFLSGCLTVVEIFDCLIEHKTFKPIEPFDASKYHIPFSFLSDLLCNPSISTEDFRLRAERYKHRLMWGSLLADSRMDVDNMVFYGESIADEVEFLRYSIQNKAASPSSLVRMKARIDEFIPWGMYGLDNLNYPIELSAWYHIGEFDSYVWLPSYCKELESKVNERLTSISGETNWDDIPLLWKLRIVAV